MQLDFKDFIIISILLASFTFNAFLLFENKKLRSEKY